jgi:hypothetical protein
MSSYACVGPRRNIKTGLEIQTAMGWLYVLEVPSVFYSAHKWKTAEGTFNTFSEIIRNSDDLSRQMLPSRRGTGYAQLRWRTGETMTFTTRTLDGGRGEETDKHIIDEALKVRSQHVGALLPALATRPLAQVLYGSSAGQATSEVLRDMRDRGRRGGDPTLGYLEYCAPLPWEEIEPGELVCDQGRECTHRRGTAGLRHGQAEGDRPRQLAVRPADPAPVLRQHAGRAAAGRVRPRVPRLVGRAGGHVGRRLSDRPRAVDRDDRRGRGGRAGEDAGVRGRGRS